ncbi:MAG: ribosome maturation factor RimP, partial [Stellaceae bacterium]
DFDRYAGFEARIELSAPHEGRKRFRGRLLGRENGTIRVATEAGEAHLPFADITRSKLVLTDDLIAAHTAQTH